MYSFICEQYIFISLQTRINHMINTFVFCYTFEICVWSDKNENNNMRARQPLRGTREKCYTIPDIDHIFTLLINLFCRACLSCFV